MTTLTYSRAAVSSWVRDRQAQVGYLSVLLFAEVVLGLLLHHLFGKLDSWLDLIGYVAGCAALLHYVHLLVEHYKPRHPGMRATLKRFAALGDEEARAVDWEALDKSIEAILQQRGRFPAAIITEWGKTVAALEGDSLTHAERLLKWLRIPKVFVRQKMSVSFLDHLTSLLTSLRLPKQVEGIFGTTLAKEIERMNVLATEQPKLKLDRDRQYTYASGIAEYYAGKARQLGIIYATALDKPSAFFSEFEKYFSSQEPLQLAAKDGFVRYAHAEVINLKVLLARFKGDTGDRPRAQGSDPVEKARIVVILRKTLLSELQNDGFWNFVRWHAENHVGLKFFIRDADLQISNDWYEQELQRRTGQTSAETIDDFIVYGGECVFGRIDPEPDLEGRVTLGFYYATPAGPGTPSTTSVIPKYREFFEVLWQDPRAYTLTELWYAADFEGELRAVSHRLAAVLEVYRDVLALKPEKSNGGRDAQA